MAKPEAPTTDEAPLHEVDESMIDRIVELFQSNRAAVDYGTDPHGWVEQNLPEGTEAGDVARCLPEVTDRLDGPYQANAARYNATHGAAGEAATQSVVNEISYTYNTVYQQNTFIYAEEGAQVVNIQGDGNHVDQTQIDLEFNAAHPADYEDEDEDGYDDGGEDPVDDHDQDSDLPEATDQGDDDQGDDDQGTEDGWGDPVDPTQDGWDDPVDPVDPGHENPFDGPTVDPVGEPAGVEEVAEAG